MADSRFFNDKKNSEWIFNAPKPGEQKSEWRKEFEKRRKIVARDNPEGKLVPANLDERVFSGSRRPG